MRTIAIVPWRPATMSRASIGQTPLPMAPAAAPAATPPRPAFIDSPLVQFVTDATAAVASGMLGYAFGRENSRWSTVFWSLSAVATFKLLFDGNRLNR